MCLWKIKKKKLENIILLKNYYELGKKLILSSLVYSIHTHTHTSAQNDEIYKWQQTTQKMATKRDEREKKTRIYNYLCVCVCLCNKFD